MIKIRETKTSMRKRILSVMVLLSLLLSLCSCSKNVDNLSNGCFDEVRHITVGVNNNFGLRDSGDEKAKEYVDINLSLLAKYIHDSVLEECNIDVQFIGLNGRTVNTGNLPDVSVASSVNTLNTYYRMNAVVNIAPYINGYSDDLSDLLSLLGEKNIYYGTEDRSEVWYLKVKENYPVANITFIRSDWLEKLNLEVPSTRAEFENCLKEFLDNAEYLLGDDSSMMIPFLIDNEPNKSAKPLFDSFYNPSAEEKDFYIHGYDHSTMPEYSSCLKLLNEWFLEGYLPADYDNIGHFTKEYYEPIENGYVGSFCASYDYLYNGEESHIDVLHNKCGEKADYIAVNTFENCEGEYAYWQEDCSSLSEKQVFLPATCTDPLACLVYLNWISKTSNIQTITEMSMNNSDLHDPYSYDRFLITTDCKFDDVTDLNSDAGIAKAVAAEVKIIQRGNKCVRYGPNFLKYCSSEVDFDTVYPDSLRRYNKAMITSSKGSFDENYLEFFNQYLTEGAGYILSMRNSEWDKVMVQGDMTPW